jgi:hypothetical protein
MFHQTELLTDPAVVVELPANAQVVVLVPEWIGGGPKRILMRADTQ